MLYLSLQRKCKRAQRKLAFNLPSAAFLMQRYDFPRNFQGFREKILEKGEEKKKIGGSRNGRTAY